MEGAPLGPIPEADLGKSADKKEKKSRKTRPGLGGLGSAATKSAERPFFDTEKPKTDKRPDKLADKPDKAESFADTPLDPKTEAPLERLGDAEAIAIRHDLALEAKQANPLDATELAADPETAAADIAVDRMLDAVIAGEDPEVAYQVALSDLDVEASDLADLPEADEQYGVSEPASDETSPDAEPTPTPDDEATVFDRSAEAAADDDEDDEADDPAAAASGSGSGGGRGSTPPPPPSTAGSTVPPPGPPGGAPRGAVVGFNPNAATPAAPTERVEYVNAGNPAADMLVGGIVGYLIGRRRGRIKTEKKLLPVQKKLEKEVKGLKKQLDSNTYMLRQAAAQKVRQNGPVVIEKLAAKPRPERPIQSERPIIVEARRTQPAPAEQAAAEQIPAEPAPEHIGHMLINASETRPRQARERQQPEPEQLAMSDEQPRQAEPVEERPLHQPSEPVKTIERLINQATEQLQQPIFTRQESQPEAAPPKLEIPKLETAEAIQNEALQKSDKPELPATKHVETLSRAELLTYSEKVAVDGSTLRQIYETHLIGERGLRRLVAEHLRGGDLKKALRREITEREIDFERDPAMRDLAVPTDSLGGSGKSSNPALDKLLQRADATVAAVNPSEEAAFYKARAHYEASQLEQHQQHRKTIDVALALTITLLVAAVIGLYLAHL